MGADMLIASLGFRTGRTQAQSVEPESAGGTLRAGARRPRAAAAPHCTDVSTLVTALPAGSLFPPLDDQLKLNVGGYSPAWLRKIVSQGGR